MTHTDERDAGPVDRYLNEMFDLLAGTGAAGRRLLTEAEEHLTEATAAWRARGMDTEAAEREAVNRFGSAASITRRLPVQPGTAMVTLRRITTQVWAVTGIALLWLGLSGALTQLLSEPWTRLLIATDRFGAHPMCEAPWFTPGIGDCVDLYRADVIFVPGGSNGLPYPVAAALGMILVASLLTLRHYTALGAPSWTPSRRMVRLVIGAAFGLAGVGLIVEAVDGIFKDVQYYVLTDFVAGLLALGIALVAQVNRARDQPFPDGAP